MARPFFFLSLEWRKRVWWPFHRNHVQQNWQKLSSVNELLTSYKEVFNNLPLTWIPAPSKHHVCFTWPWAVRRNFEPKQRKNWDWKLLKDKQCEEIMFLFQLTVRLIKSRLQYINGRLLTTSLWLVNSLLTLDSFCRFCYTGFLWKGHQTLFFPTQWQKEKRSGHARLIMWFNEGHDSTIKLNYPCITQSIIYIISFNMFMCLW